MSDNLEESRAANEIYRRVDAREREDIYKSAEFEMAEILKQREDGIKNIVKMEGENPAVAEARFWTLRKDLLERYSICERILNEGL